MKNKTKLGILVLALVLGMTIVGCDDGSDSLPPEPRGGTLIFRNHMPPSNFALGWDHTMVFSTRFPGEIEFEGGVFVSPGVDREYTQQHRDVTIAYRVYHRRNWNVSAPLVFCYQRTVRLHEGRTVTEWLYCSQLDGDCRVIP